MESEMNVQANQYQQLIATGRNSMPLPAAQPIPLNMSPSSPEHILPDGGAVMSSPESAPTLPPVAPPSTDRRHPNDRLSDEELDAVAGGLKPTEDEPFLPYY